MMAVDSADRGGHERSKAWKRRMAHENRDWGHMRLQGALSNLGHKIARSTIADILKRHGIEPAPERSRKTDVLQIAAGERSACEFRLCLSSETEDDFDEPDLCGDIAL
jgi:hypothetical protein